MWLQSVRLGIAPQMSMDCMAAIYKTATLPQLCIIISTTAIINWQCCLSSHYSVKIGVDWVQGFMSNSGIKPKVRVHSLNSKDQ